MAAVFMGCRIAQGKQRIKQIQRGKAVFRFHILRLVHNHNRARLLNPMNRRIAAFVHLVDHIAVFFKRLDIDHHNLNAVIHRKITQRAQTLAVVLAEIHHRFVKQLGKMVFRRPQRLQHAFANRHTRHDNHKFRPTVLAVQLKNRAQIHIGFARARFHFHRKIQTVLPDFRFRLPKGFLHVVQVFADLHPIQIQLIADKKLDARIVQAETFATLPFKQTHHRIHGIGLVG